MKRSIFIICFILLIALGTSFSSTAAEDKCIEGIWQGDLDVGSGMKINLIIKISKNQDGTLSATMDSPAQGVKDIRIDIISFDNGRLVFEMTAKKVSYEGEVNKDCSEIQGQFKQGALNVPLVLKKTDKVTEISRPQEPKRPFPYDEEEVSYENKKAGIKLAGTLTLPRSKGPFPAVVLITGSGAQNRDEALLGHRPFFILADYLTRRGIAVLRVDDRGVGGSTGDISESTSIDFAGDVLTGVAYLKGRKEINPKQIGLIGHSEGGIIAPIAASKSKDVAFIVMMAGTGITGEEILYLQGALIAKANGASDEDLAKARTEQERIYKIMREEKDPAVLEEKLMKLTEESIAGLSEEEKKAIGDPKAAAKAQMERLNSTWFRFFLTYDPKTALRKVKCPVLAINGDLDLQVPAKENLEAIKQALEEGGNKDYTIMALPNLNHLFQFAKTGSPAEYAEIEETISPKALKIIGDWILEKTK